jgi:hypothetical protein
MKTRIAAWTMFVVCVQVSIGCGGSNASSNPINPSPPPTPIATPTPPPPPRALSVDLTGNYALTFEVGSACEQVPKELRIRTYEARIEYRSSGSYRSDESSDSFLADLSGATFHDQRPVWIEVTHRASGHSVWLDLALSDNVILEEPERGTYFMVAGWDGVASVDPTELSTISTPFTGYFNYCVATSEIGPQNQCSVDTMMRSACKSENSRWTLTRR